MPNRGRKQKGDGTNADPSGEKTTTTKDHNVVEQVEKKVLPVPDKLILRLLYLMKNSRWNECLRLTRKLMAIQPSNEAYKKSYTLFFYLIKNRDIIKRYKIHPLIQHSINDRTYYKGQGNAFVPGGGARRGNYRQGQGNIVPVQATAATAPPPPATVHSEAAHQPTDAAVASGYSKVKFEVVREVTNLMEKSLKLSDEEKHNTSREVTTATKDRRGETSPSPRPTSSASDSERPPLQPSNTPTYYERQHTVTPAQHSANHRHPHHHHHNHHHHDNDNT